MSLSIKGYVLEPPRVGQSNSPFTYTPNIYISDQGSFDAAYPSDESVPRTEYHVFVLNDDVQPRTGPNGNHSFVDSTFAWTKNEVITRFDYKGSEGRFKTLPGAGLYQAGSLAADANTTRLKVPAPISTDFTTYPVRLSLGTGSGTTILVTTVLTDGDFTLPSVGTAQISLATGDLNWNPADITTFTGEKVRFQRQNFYTFEESTGLLGVIDDVLLLNPLPATGQFPLIRIGFGEFLIPVEVTDEASFSANPTAGTVEWAATTGRLKFNSGDVATNTTRSVYYDGSTFAFGATIKTTTMGTVNSPGILTLPPEESDLFFRVPGTVQFAQTQFVSDLTTPGKKGVVQVRRSDGQVQFSVADQGRYGADVVQAVVADLDIERGMTLRMFRSPVNLDDSSASLKDVAAFYVSTSAVWAQPIIASPTVHLPSVPVDSRTLNVNVIQGTGTFVGNLPRLDVAVPPAGVGYIIDYEAQNLIFAERKVNVITPAPTPYGGVQLDPLLFSAGLDLELETAPGSGIFAPLTLGEDALIDLPSGLITTVSTAGRPIVSGSSASFSGVTFTDATQDFTTVLPGDYLVVLTGGAKGVYTVVGVSLHALTTDQPGITSSGLSYEVLRGVEILADRFFEEIPPVDPNTKIERLRNLGTVTNSPRLTIDPKQAANYRFRFGLTFSTNTITVTNDGSFTAPGSLAQGTVEVSLSTGNLNFSQADVTAGGAVFGARTLTLGADYTLQPPLGFIQFTERFLELEEAFLTYVNSDGNVVEERGTFLVRKEKVQDHPTPTNVLSFNPLAREVAIPPTPRAFRGGRPQTSDQVRFDATTSTVTFIGATTVTDALPSGPTIAPSENVYVDYSIYQAMGGEQSISVLQPPMQGVTIVINSDTNSFTIAGDRTANFVPNSILLVDRTEAYLIGTVVLNAGVTTITLAGTQQFRSDFQNPKLAVSSGVTRVTGTVSAPSYFVTELAAYDPVPKGSSTISLSGDVSKAYVAGTVVLFTNGTYTDFNVVSGSKFDSTTGKTAVTLIANGSQQYSGVTLKRSVRPILATPSVKATTAQSPNLALPFLVFRRTEGAVGTILKQPDDYTIDQSGAVSVVVPLAPNEEIGIFYTGAEIIEAGRSFRASYTHTIAPTDQNGLLNQTLLADYTTYAPDTFYWRVETFTNFRGELAEQYETNATSNVPSGGPNLENSSSPKLFEQGRESVFFQEEHLANEDLVARPTLKYYNDAVNSLEDALQGLDGRVVGDHDGRFLFDGLIDNPARTTFADVTNQIDDRFMISPAPYTVTGPPFVVTSVGTFQEVYKAAPTSRFYPTKRVLFGVTVPTVGLKTGDPVMDTGSKNLKSVSFIERRFPWAVVTQVASTGSHTLMVDAAQGDSDLIRPAFAAPMKVAITAQDGTVLVADSPGMTVQSVTSTSITLTGPVPTDIPIGATIRLSTADTAYFKQYRLGIDIGVDLDNGLLTYQAPSPPWNDPSVPTVLQPSPPNSAGGEVLDVTATIVNTLTAPDRFPALDGSTQDDDHNRQFPILTPSVTSEAGDTGLLTLEDSIIQASTGTIRINTTPPFVGTGSLDVSKTVITNTGGAWPSPIPKAFDLVEIRTGLNAPSSFHQITAVGGSTITVTPPFASVDTGFTFTVTVSADLIVSTCTVTSLNTLTDNTVDFIAANIVPGQTVAFTSGPLVGLRRQVVAVTQHVLTIATTPTNGSGNYRLTNSLETFGGVNSIRDAQLVPALQGQLLALSTGTNPVGEVPALEAFFSTALTTITGDIDGVTSTSTFTSVGATFVTLGITTANLLFIRSGTAAGVYKISQILSETSLLIEGTFPVNTTGITYQVVSTVGLTAEPLQEILTILLETETDLASLTPFLAIVATPISVVPDTNAFAVRTLTSDLDARATIVADRFAAITNSTGYVASLEAELSSGDRLYDKRYVWIDARINLTNGILVKRDLAKASRIKAQADVLNQLTKLLSVQTP